MRALLRRGGTLLAGAGVGRKASQSVARQIHGQLGRVGMAWADVGGSLHAGTCAGAWMPAAAWRHGKGGGMCEVAKLCGVAAWQSGLRGFATEAAATARGEDAPLERVVRRKQVTWYGTRISTDPTAPSVIRRRPTTPSQRHTAIIDKTYLWRGSPHKALTKGIKRSGGRNNQGVITVRGKGGGNKRKYRLIDFKRAHPKSTGIVRGIVERIEYDPNRTALIALLRHAPADQQGYAGEAHAALSYIVCPRGITVGNEVHASRSEALDVKPGNSMQLRHVPVGTLVHNIELKPGGRPFFARMLLPAGFACSSACAGLACNPARVRPCVLLCGSVLPRESGARASPLGDALAVDKACLDVRLLV